ncbi:hypothetical protein NKH61_09270 [Mesorhizobium sp. M1005]|uniref:hypothetical protein n=1 Tax=unclassified Mesorhizobium TaxID=325217 RepID=UPI0033370DD7
MAGDARHAKLEFFAIVGAPLDVAAIACPGLLAWMLRSDRPAFWWILAATVLYLMALVAWFTLVKPANDVLATWVPGPIPDNFESVRSSWETGHMEARDMNHDLVSITIEPQHFRRQATWWRTGTSAP